ncbi:MAG: phosphotransferase, partial [Pseudomonadota bacterium]
GPEILDVVWDDAEVTVTCSPAKAAVVQGYGCAATATHGESMTVIKVPLTRFAASDWMRLTVVGHDGTRAWTNPVWRS